MTPTQQLRGIGVHTPWVTYPGLYTATCEHNASAIWLQVNADRTPGDRRPTVTAALGATWGYHQQDVNLSLGDLVRDVAHEEAAYR